MKFIFILAMTVVSCSTGFESKQVYLEDEAGSPVIGASTYPQPINRKENLSNEKGRIYIYGLVPESTCKIVKRGFRETEVVFGEVSPTSVVVMSSE